MSKFPKVKVQVTGDDPELNKKVINVLHHLIGSRGVTTSIPEALYDHRPDAGSCSELEELNVQVAFSD